MPSNANIVIEQSPLKLMLPVHQEVMFSVSDTNLVINKERVKFIAYVYVATDLNNLGSNDYKAATLKVTPNNAGVGIFDLRPILEAYVSPEYLANGEDSGEYYSTTSSTYKGVEFSDAKSFPVHLIDQWSLSNNLGTFFKVKFAIEYLDENAVVVDDNLTITFEYFIFNGYVKFEDTLVSQSGIGGSFGNYCFGLNLQELDNKDGTFRSVIQNGDTANFISDAPATQYARLTDYGTVATFNRLSLSEFSFATAPSGTNNRVFYVQIKLYDSSGSQLGSAFNITNSIGNGGAQPDPTYANLNKSFIQFFGCFPANLDGGYIENSSIYADWNTHKANVSYYTIGARDNNNNRVTELYRINIICENSFGYEGIRLAWLNRWGAWDYYTFNQKSVRSLTTNKTNYTQLGGSWNKEYYIPHGYKGGKKNFRMNTKERITINTDFLNDLESVWIEDLMNSPEVYIINKKSTDKLENAALASAIVHKYVEPVIVTTSNFVRKTKANDKLIQYTIEIERNKTQRTQSA